MSSRRRWLPIASVGSVGFRGLRCWLSWLAMVCFGCGVAPTRPEPQLVQGDLRCLPILALPPDSERKTQRVDVDLVELKTPSAQRCRLSSRSANTGSSKLTSTRVANPSTACLPNLRPDLHALGLTTLRRSLGGLAVVRRWQVQRASFPSMNRVPCWSAPAAALPDIIVRWVQQV